MVRGAADAAGASTQPGLTLTGASGIYQTDPLKCRGCHTHGGKTDKSLIHPAPLPRMRTGRQEARRLRRLPQTPGLRRILRDLRLLSDISNMSAPSAVSQEDATTSTGPIPNSLTGAAITEASPTSTTTSRSGGNARTTAAVASTVPTSASLWYIRAW